MSASLPHIAHPPFLVSIDVPDDRSLRIVVEERTGLGPDEDDWLGGREIIPAPGDGHYEILWDIVVCFAVRGDPFPAGVPSTATIYEMPATSGFMAWVKDESHADPDYLAALNGDVDAPASELRHWRVSCNEASFDVAAPEPPVVRRVSC